MSAYESVILTTFAAALLVVLLFCILIARRYWQEKQKDIIDKRDAEILRSYMQRVKGQKAQSHPKWTKAMRLHAISRILPLLKGDERERLLQIAELDGVLKSKLRTSHSFEKAERISAIHFLQRYGGEASIARLREILAEDKSPRVKIEAAFALASHDALPPPRETLALLESFTRKPSHIDGALLRSMAPRYHSHLTDILTEEIPDDWRAEIVEALGWSQDISVQWFIEQAFAHENLEVRSAAIRAASRLGHPSSREMIKWALVDDDDVVKLQAVTASARFNMKCARPQIEALSDSDNLWLKVRSEQALERL